MNNYEVTDVFVAREAGAVIQAGKGCCIDENGEPIGPPAAPEDE